MKMLSSDLKSLKRAAIEPARVFARRDFDPNEKRPVLHFSWNDREFYSPHFPTWMFESGDECGVIEKAIDRYGLEEAPVTGRWWDFAEFLFDPTKGQALVLDEPEMRVMTNGAHVAFYWLGGIDFIAATPVAYAQRRWDGDFSITKDGKFARIITYDDDNNGRVVGVIRCQDGSYLSDPADLSGAGVDA